MSDTTTEILIVGAGMSGLMAANVLQQNKTKALLLDKGHSVGGRLATRRIGPGRADHGAQFFTVRSPHFHTWIKDWQAEGLVFRWSQGWSSGSLIKAKPDGYPRYAITGGMNALAKRLAQRLDVLVNQEVVAVSTIGAGWRVDTETGQSYTARILVMTPPVPQSLALLEAGNTQLSANDSAALSRIEYVSCVAGLFWVDGSVNLPEPGAMQTPGADISWVADNRRKGISPEATLITVHAGADYSRYLWDLPEDEVLALIQEQGLAPYLDSGATVKEAQLKLWRYAMPITFYPNRCLLASDLPPLIFAGDAFGEARVEGAALSGIVAAQKILGVMVETKTG